MERSLEGWCTDPYARHQARWISVGRATALVRDGEIDGNDPPPDEPFVAAPIPLEADGATDGDDLRRADDGEDPKKALFRQMMTDNAEFGPS